MCPALGIMPLITMLTVGQRWVESNEELLCISFWRKKVIREQSEDLVYRALHVSYRYFEPVWEGSAKFEAGLRKCSDVDLCRLRRGLKRLNLMHKKQLISCSVQVKLSAPFAVPSRTPSHGGSFSCATRRQARQCGMRGGLE
eukprot:jgi/Botrbrau1/17273/Bobra.0015s0031.1